MASDETITEITNMYTKMSLLELLTEENMMAKFLHRRTPDSVRRELQKVLRSEIEKKLQ